MSAAMLHAFAAHAVVSCVIDDPVTSYLLANPILSALFALITYLAFFIIREWPYQEYTLSFHNVPGPPPTSWFWGNFKEIINEPLFAPQDRWRNKYGKVFRHRGMWGTSRLFLGDPVAIATLGQHSYSYVKPKEMVYTLEQFIGRGLVTVEGDAHRRQRRIINPAFGQHAIKDMHDIFLDKSFELQRKLSGFLDAEEGETEQLSFTPAMPEDRILGTKKIDIFKYINQLTIDVVGLAGFDYDFKALAGEHNHLARAIENMLLTMSAPNVMAILSMFVPPLRILPNNVKAAVTHARVTTDRVAGALAQAKKILVEAELATGKINDVLGKDLLSRVIRANMDPALKSDQRMTDAEVVAQVATFMIAANETTSSTLAFILQRLAENPDVQKKLRDEVRAVLTDRPSFEELNTLPYLESVIHEVLRMDPAVPGTIRIATKHDVLPLSRPVVGRNGKLIDSIKISPGADIFIPVRDINRDPEIWGPDAHLFKPGRLLQPGMPLEHVAGPYGNVMSFLVGAHNCIGFRFALAEIKCVLFALFRNIEFSLLPSNPEIFHKMVLVSRPVVYGEARFGFQMPLLARALPDDA